MIISGSYNMTAHYIDNDDINITGSYNTPRLITSHGVPTNYDHIWEQMYVKPRPVIIVCGYCKSHNAVDNPTCVRCGAPMGYGVLR